MLRYSESEKSHRQPMCILFRLTTSRKLLCCKISARPWPKQGISKTRKTRFSFLFCVAIKTLIEGLAERSSKIPKLFFEQLLIKTGASISALRGGSMGPCNDSFFSIEICLVENSVYILTNCQNIQNSNFRFSITVFFCFAKSCQKSRSTRVNTDNTKSSNDLFLIVQHYSCLEFSSNYWGYLIFLGGFGRHFCGPLSQLEVPTAKLVLLF